jgi:protein CLEC16A
VIDQMQFILIEPDVKKVGWGIVKFCDLMQVSRSSIFRDIYIQYFKDVEVVNDKEDSRSLHITIHKPVNNIYVKTSPPILNAKFTFDDHIRCMTAKQNLIKGRQRYS